MSSVYALSPFSFSASCSLDSWILFSSWKHLVVSEWRRRYKHENRLAYFPHDISCLYACSYTFVQRRRRMKLISKWDYTETRSKNLEDSEGNSDFLCFSFLREKGFTGSLNEPRHSSLMLAAITHRMCINPIRLDGNELARVSRAEILCKSWKKEKRKTLLFIFSLVTTNSKEVGGAGSIWSSYTQPKGCCESLFFEWSGREAWSGVDVKLTLIIERGCKVTWK